MFVFGGYDGSSRLNDFLEFKFGPGKENLIHPRPCAGIALSRERIMPRFPAVTRTTDLTGSREYLFLNYVPCRQVDCPSWGSLASG
jgi:hypothetical protein